MYNNSSNKQQRHTCTATNPINTLQTLESGMLLISTEVCIKLATSTLRLENHKSHPVCVVM